MVILHVKVSPEVAKLSGCGYPRNGSREFEFSGPPKHKWGDQGPFPVFAVALGSPYFWYCGDGKRSCPAGRAHGMDRRHFPYCALVLRGIWKWRGRGRCPKRVRGATTFGPRAPYTWGGAGAWAPGFWGRGRPWRFGQRFEKTHYADKNRKTAPAGAEKRFSFRHGAATRALREA
jgi:hypothetical protein